MTVLRTVRVATACCGNARTTSTIPCWRVCHERARVLSWRSTKGTPPAAVPSPMRLAFALPFALLASVAAPAHADPAPRDAVAARFAADPDASRLALDLFDTDSDVVDVLPAQRFD